MEHATHPMGMVGHDRHAMMIADFKKRFYIVLALAVPILLLSPAIQHWLTIHIEFPGSSYFLLALSTIVFIHGGWPFLKGSVEEMKAPNPGIRSAQSFEIIFK
ncbi:MAG TPA: hypothetical protein VGM31_09315 [Puia sp.]